jgi:hypothetical protein
MTGNDLVNMLNKMSSDELALPVLLTMESGRCCFSTGHVTDVSVEEDEEDEEETMMPKKAIVISGEEELFEGE